MRWPLTARAAMPPGMYHTAQLYRALLVLGSADLLAPLATETLFWFLRLALPTQTLHRSQCDEAQHPTRRGKPDGYRSHFVGAGQKVSTSNQAKC